MKKDILIGVSAGIGGFILGALLLFFIYSPGKSAKSTISLDLPSIKELNDKYLARVEQYGISYDEFTNSLELVQKTLPPAQLAQLKANESAFKAEILETLINQYVVVATAIEEGFLENEENYKQFQNALYQALSQLYISKNLPADKNAFAPSNPEIDQAYQQFGSELRARGFNAQQSREFIINQLSQQKQQRWMVDFISKIKEGFRIERNNKLIEKEGIDPIGLQTPLQPQ